MPPKTRKPRVNPKNYDLARGIKTFSQGAMFRRKGIWAFKVKGKQQKKVHEVPKPVTKAFGKKGETRVILPRRHSQHPLLDQVFPELVKKKKTTKKVRAPVALKSNIKPGQVLILLAGPHRGKRVVFLKQLQSGLLAITGPYVVNGTPVRRVDQTYVIVTSTNVDISGVKLDTLNDDFFKKPQQEKKKKSETEFFDDKAKDKKKRVVAPEKISTQKSVDTPLLAVLKKQPLLRSYLGSRFTLSHGQYPHNLKF